MTASDISLAMPVYPVGEPVDIDARAADFMADAILRARRQYWFDRTPFAYRAANTTPAAPDHNFDISHSTIQRNRAQLEQIVGWKYASKGLLASGPTNLGKTRAMYALCHRLLCEESRDVGIWHAQDFFSALQAEIKYGRDEAEGFVKRQAARPVLFIDDYGQEAVQSNRQDWAQGWFFRLLDLRIGNGLPLLMTSNLTARQMADGARDVASDPMVRRLLDVCEPIKFI